MFSENEMGLRGASSSHGLNGTCGFQSIRLEEIKYEIVLNYKVPNWTYNDRMTPDMHNALKGHDRVMIWDRLFDIWVVKGANDNKSSKNLVVPIPEDAHILKLTYHDFNRLPLSDRCLDFKYPETVWCPSDNKLSHDDLLDYEKSILDAIHNQTEADSENI